MLLFNGKRVQISAGFCLLLCWFWRANSWALLLTVLSAAMLHEMGHCAALLCFGGQIRRLRLSIFGAELEADCRCLSYGREALALLAGPAANLLAAAIAVRLPTERSQVFAGANLALCLFNLLPVRPLDGGRAAELLCARMWDEAAGERVARVSSICISVLLCSALCALMWCSGGSLWLIPAAVGFGMAAWQESCRK